LFLPLGDQKKKKKKRRKIVIKKCERKRKLGESDIIMRGGRGVSLGFCEVKQ